MRKRRTQRAEQRTTLVAPVVALARFVFSVLFPSDCRLCGLPLVNISRLPVCEKCLASLPPIRAPQYAQCGERLMPAQLLVGDRRCHGCHKFQPDVDRAVPYGEYAGSVRGVIHLLRYDSVMPTAPAGIISERSFRYLSRSDIEATPNDHPAEFPKTR